MLREPYALVAVLACLKFFTIRSRLRKRESVTTPVLVVDPTKLNVLGIGDLANALLEKQQGIVETRSNIDMHLKRLSLTGDTIKSTIKVSGMTASDDLRLRQLLEKLDLILPASGKAGLGSNNLLFMACELLLLAQEDEGNKLLLIEEPEAHLPHPAPVTRDEIFAGTRGGKGHSGHRYNPRCANLASAIELNNIVMIHTGRAFSLAEGQTELERSITAFWSDSSTLVRLICSSHAVL